MSRVKHLAYACVATIMLLTLVSCGAQLPDISEYGDTPIEIVGLLDEDFTITPNELAKLKFENTSAKGTSDKAGTVNGIGPSLITFLARYGKTPADFKTIRFTASDAYTIRLSGEKCAEDMVLFSISGKTSPLPKGEQPMRLIMPDADSSQWIYGVVRIEFTPVED